MQRQLLVPALPVQAERDVRPLPPLAYLPMMVIWFGIGETAKILLIFLACFAPVALAAPRARTRWSLPGANRTTLSPRARRRSVAPDALGPHLHTRPFTSDPPSGYKMPDRGIALAGEAVVVDEARGLGCASLAHERAAVTEA